MSVREAQARIDAREFAEWMAFDRVEQDAAAAAHEPAAAKPMTADELKAAAVRAQGILQMARRE